MALTQFDKVVCNFPSFKREMLREVVLTASLYHDFGKATSFFQNYIVNPDVTSTEVQRMRRRHGLISAIATYRILKEKFPEHSVLPIFGFIIVRKHHGNLENYRNLLTISENELMNCRIQAEHIDYDEIRNIVKNDAIDKNLIYDFNENWRELKRKDRTFTVEHYFVLNLLYSILLQADKSDAILRNALIKESPLLKSRDVHNFKKGFKRNRNNPINLMRENAFNSVEKTIEKLKKTERILSINIPTGSGKTITSLNAALKLCEIFHHDHVVYCLPFTSVIDQNFKVFDEIRKNAGMVEDSGILLKHHYLAEVNYKSVSDENIVKEYLPNESLHLIENWESRITVTTFVQFVYSLISYKNASLQKFQRLGNAVIILDEIQSIPHHYWKLIKEMLHKTAEWLNSRIILVTATMPLIFSEEEREIKELVSGKKQLFERINRIELDVSNLKNEKMEWSEFCKAAKEIAYKNTTKDILFVMNTIRTAKELFRFFKNTDELAHELIFLSAHVVPKERLKRIKEIKNRKADKPILVVSTQLVEAGVDIDLDIVVRDFAPLDCIFQTCGRCNRENRNNDKGKVILFYIKDSNNKIPSSIYQDFLKQKTRKILKDKDIIPESDFFDLAKRYFGEVQIGGSQSLSEDLLEKIQKLKYSDGDQKIELSLIDDNFSASVFVELDDAAISFWNEYQNVLEMESGFEKKSLLKKAKRNLAEYIINVPKNSLPNKWIEGIYRIPSENADEYYDRETGFITDFQLPEPTTIF